MPSQSLEGAHRWALYQTIHRARKALSVVLRVVAHTVAPSVVNMVNEHEDLGDDFILTG